MKTYNIIACDGNEYLVKAHSILYNEDSKVIYLLHISREIIGVISLVNIIAINLVENNMPDEAKEDFQRTIAEQLIKS